MLSIRDQFSGAHILSYVLFCMLIDDDEQWVCLQMIDSFLLFLNELSWRSMILKQKESMWGSIAQSLNNK